MNKVSFCLLLCFFMTNSLKVLSRSGNELVADQEITLKIGQMLSLDSSNYPNEFVRHRNFEIWRDPFQNNDLYKKDSTFIVRPANNKKDGYISFESVNYPGRFIRHANYVLWLHESDGSTLFNDDSSFRVTAPRNGKAGYVSFESSNFPNHFIRHAGGRVRIDSSLFYSN